MVVWVAPVKGANRTDGVNGMTGFGEKAFLICITRVGIKNIIPNPKNAGKVSVPGTQVIGGLQIALD